MNNAWEKLTSVALGVAALAIASVLVHREFFDTAAAQAPREVRLPEYVEEWQEMVPVGRLVGRPDARVKLIEFADLECPFCRGFNATVGRVLEKYPNDVALVFVHLPLPGHRFAQPAAKAAECAYDAGRFSQMVDAVYERQDSLGLKSWTSFAVRAGIRDTSAFARCLANPKTPSAVEAGLALSSKVGISGTPTVLLNGWRYPSPPAEDQLVKDIETLLAGRQLQSNR